MVGVRLRGRETTDTREYEGLNRAMGIGTKREGFKQKLKDTTGSPW